MSARTMSIFSSSSSTFIFLVILIFSTSKVSCEDKQVKNDKTKVEESQVKAVISSGQDLKAEATGHGDHYSHGHGGHHGSHGDHSSHGGLFSNLYFPFSVTKL